MSNLSKAVLLFLISSNLSVFCQGLREKIESIHKLREDIAVENPFSLVTKDGRKITLTNTKSEGRTKYILNIDGKSQIISEGESYSTRHPILDEINNRIIITKGDRFQIIDYSSTPLKTITCQKNNVMFDDIFFRKGVPHTYSFQEGSIHFYRLEIKKECETIPIGSTSPSGLSDRTYWNMNVQSTNDDQLRIFYNNRKKGMYNTNTDELEYIGFKFNPDGTIQTENPTRKTFSDYSLNTPWNLKDYQQNLISPKNGEMLLILDRPNRETPEEENSLFKSDGENLVKITDNVLNAHWLNNGNILVTIGSHAASSELSIYNSSGELLFRLKTPIGYKRVTHLDDNFAYFKRSTALGSEEIHRIPISKDGESELVYRNEELNIQADKLTSVQVKVKSGKRIIPALLLKEPKVCKEKKPAFVYLHGGGFNSNAPSGHRAEGLALPKAIADQGYPVLMMNYFGDKFLGGNYLVRGKYAEKDYANKELLDIESAYEHLKKNADEYCIDTSKIILVGFSNGAILSSLYITEKRDNDIPYAGTILIGGRYRKEDVDRLGLPDFRSPRLAWRNHESGKEISPGPAQEFDFNIEDDGKGNPCKGLDHALSVLNQLGPSVDAVIYNLSNSYLDRVLASRRVENVTKKPVFVIQGSDDVVEGAKELAKKFKQKNKLIKTWFPEGATHSIYPLEVDRDIKIIEFLNELSEK